MDDQKFKIMGWGRKFSDRTLAWHPQCPGSITSTKQTHTETHMFTI